MKKLTKLFGLVLILALVLSMGLVSASAADAPTRGSISIRRPIKEDNYGNTYTEGEYHLYRIFDASVAFDANGAATGAISYTCTDAQKAIEGFSDYFTADEANNVSATEAAIGSVGEDGVPSLSAAAVQWIKANIAALGTPVNVTYDRWSWQRYTNSNPEVLYYTYESLDNMGSAVYTVHNLPFGYYFIDSTVGSAVMIDSAHPDAEILDKNQVPSMTKEITAVTNLNEETVTRETSTLIAPDGSGALAQIGDTVSYSITVTARRGAERYVLSDVMHPGLTLLPGSIGIQVKVRVLSEDPAQPDQFEYVNLDPQNYTLFTDAEYEGFYYKYDDHTIRLQKNGVLGDAVYTISGPWQQNEGLNIANSYYYDPDAGSYSRYGSRIVVVFNQDYLNTITADTEIVLSYDAVLNEKAVNTNYLTNKQNEAVLNYGHSESIYDYATVNSLQLVVFKYEGNGDSSSSAGSKPLNGVGFVLKRQSGGQDEYLQQDPASLAIKWVKNLNEATRLVTGTQMIWTYTYQNSYYGNWVQVPMDGYLIVDGLTAGAYTLVETDPLPGFNRAKDINFTLPSQTHTANWWRVQLNISNKTGTLLPETGGIGVTVYYLLGLLLLANGTVLLLRRKEKAAGER